MVVGTALSGATGAAAAPVAAVPVGKAIPVAAGNDMVEKVRHRHRHRHHRHRHRHGDAALAIGAAGLFLGLSALAARPHHHHHHYYRYDRPVRYRYEPWSPAWFDYCMARYRSFNPETGYFKGYDGKYHFCR